MKCVFCPYCPEGREACPEPERYWMVYGDGEEGCTKQLRIIKRDVEHQEHIRQMAKNDAELEEYFESHNISLTKVIRDAKRAIGFTRRKKYFRMHRNCAQGNNTAFEHMSTLEPPLCRRWSGAHGETFYTLTREGLDWLERRTNIKIICEN